MPTRRTTKSDSAAAERDVTRPSSSPGDSTAQPTAKPARPAPEPTPPAPASADPSTDTPAAPARPGGVGRAVGVLFRLVALVAVVVAIGAAVYFGWPVVYDRVIAPIQTNTADVGALRARIADLERQVGELRDADEGLEAGLANADERFAEHARRLDELDRIASGLGEANERSQADVGRRLEILRAMELMSRARLFMYQSNFGLAEQDVAAARDLLAGLRGTGTSTDAAVIASAVDRLDRTLAALPDFPVVASDDLDIAWQALLGRVPEAVEPDATPTPEPAASPSSEPSPGASPVASPNASPSP